MALHITNLTVEHEVRALATERGQTITDVIGAAVRDFKRRNQQAPKPKPSVEEVLEFIRDFLSGPVNYGRTEDEFLGYGPNGAFINGAPDNSGCLVDVHYVHGASYHQF